MTNNITFIAAGAGSGKTFRVIQEIQKRLSAVRVSFTLSRRKPEDTQRYSPSGVLYLIHQKGEFVRGYFEAITHLSLQFFTGLQCSLM